MADNLEEGQHVSYVVAINGLIHDVPHAVRNATQVALGQRECRGRYRGDRRGGKGTGDQQQGECTHYSSLRVCIDLASSLRRGTRSLALRERGTPL